jgi:hypothetical protein
MVEQKKRTSFVKENFSTKTEFSGFRMVTWETLTNKKRMDSSLLILDVTNHKLFSTTLILFYGTKNVKNRCYSLLPHPFSVLTIRYNKKLATKRRFAIVWLTCKMLTEKRSFRRRKLLRKMSNISF